MLRRDPRAVESLTLANAVIVTDVTFNLTYNPALFNLSDTRNGAGTLTLLSNSAGLASFSFHSSMPLRGALLTLGQLVAQVPNSAAASYKAVELLHPAPADSSGKTPAAK